MTRKRFVKLLMGSGMCVRQAREYAEQTRRQGKSYAAGWAEMHPDWAMVLRKTAAGVTEALEDSLKGLVNAFWEVAKIIVDGLQIWAEKQKEQGRCNTTKTKPKEPGRPR